MYNESSLTDASSVSINGDQNASFADFCEKEHHTVTIHSKTALDWFSLQIALTAG